MDAGFARCTFVLVSLAVGGAPVAAQSQPPFVEAEAVHPLAATLPVLDIATEGERIAVAWFVSGALFNGTSDAVVELVSRDANGAIVVEPVVVLQSIAQWFGPNSFTGLAGPRYVDVTPQAVVTATSSWNLQSTGGQPVFTPFSYAVTRHERQTDGTWLELPVLGALFATPLDVVATDGLVVCPLATLGTTPFHQTVVTSYPVRVAVPGTAPSWTATTLTTTTPAQTGAPRVATDGETVVVGLQSPTASTTLSGRVELYRRDGGGTWQLEQTLTASDAFAGDRFGCAVSIDGDRLAVSAVQPGTGTFVAYVFERTPGTTGPWSEVAKLVPPLPHAPVVSTATTNVEVVRGRVVVAQPLSDVHAPGAGSADVFMRSPAGAWEHSVRLAPRAGASRGFTSLDADGDRVVAGAIGIGADRGTYDIFEFGSLLAVGDGPSIAAPAPQVLAIDEGVENAGDVYALLGSLTGTSPGVPVAGTPFTLPLVLDAYFESTLLSIGGGGLLSAPVGVLDNRGRATCSFTIPPGLPPSLAGLKVHHAAVVFDLQAVGVPATHVTNPVVSVLVP